MPVRHSDGISKSLSDNSFREYLLDYVGMYGQLTYERFVLITAEVYDASADQVEPTICRAKAEAALAEPFPGPDEIVLYPDRVEQAALCCAAIIRHRPLPHSNKRVACASMQEMLMPRRLPSSLTEESPEMTKKLDDLADGSIGDGQFVCWVRAQLGLGDVLRYLSLYGLTA